MDYSRSNLNQDLPQLVVHNYVQQSSATTLSLRAVVLDVGRRLVTAASSHRATGWSSIKIADAKEAFAPAAGKGYIFSRPPPEISYLDGRRRTPGDLMEWGSPVGGQEVITLEQLTEFQGIDFTYLSLRSVEKQVDHTSKRAIKTSQKLSVKTSVNEPARKLDVASLYNVVPQPHMHRSPSTLGPTSRPRIARYDKAQPVAIEPYTSGYLGAIPEYGRSAWIIPVRGSPPWEGCSTAITFSPLCACLPMAPGRKADAQITWTHPSLVSFWSFLQAIQKAGTLGSIGLSFHAAPVSHRASSSATYSYTSYVGRQKVDTTPPVGESPQFVGTDAASPRSPLSAVDHIKVYHDAAHAMFVRNVLDIWGFEVPSAEEQAGSATKSHSREHEAELFDGQAKAKKIRVLKGAKLVLVDECSRGILIA